MLITIEGIDGSGKSTLVQALSESLQDLDPVFTKEPGATWVGESVRRAIRERMDPITEALLFTADHAAHLTTIIRPALNEGRLVIADRFTDSRYAYQTIMLGGSLPAPLTWLRKMHEGWTIRPDRTFLMVIPVDMAMERLTHHAKREHFEDPAILARVQALYLDLAAEDPPRFVLVDALKGKEEIHAFVETEIRRLAGWSRKRPR